MKRLVLMLIISVLIFSLVLGGCAGQAPAPKEAPEAAPEQTGKPSEEPEKVIELTYNDWTSETILPSKVIQEAFARIEERSNGRVKIIPYFSETLLKQPDAFIGTATGAADMSIMVANELLGKLHLNLIFNRLFTVEAPEYQKMGKLYTELLENVPEIQQEMEGAGVRWLSIAPSPPTQLHTNKKPVRVPADVKGMKIRASGDIATLITNMGGSGISLPPADWFMSLERGLTEGDAIHWAAIGAFYGPEIFNYHTMLGLDASGRGYIINLNTWNSLPPDIQEILVEGFTWANDQIIERNRAYIEEVIAKAKADGNTIIEITPEERQLWSEYIKPTNDAWVAEAEAKGWPAKKAYAELEKLLVKY